MRVGAAVSEKKKAIAALILLSFFWALDGLAPDLFPALRHSVMPVMERQAITFAIVALGAAVYAVARRINLPNRREGFAWATAGVLMFAAPAMLTLFTQSSVSQLERVAIFSLVPVFAVVLEPHIGYATRHNNGALLASLTAVAGALAIFPLSVPGTPAAVLGVFALVIAAACAAIGNCIAVRIAGSQVEYSATASALWMCSASALSFGLASAFTERTHWHPPNMLQFGWLIAVDLPPLLLLFWLLCRMSATRMTVRFLLAPLLTVLAGIALEQPQITARMIIGVGLLAAGSLWLLLADESEETEVGIL